LDLFSFRTSESLYGNRSVAQKTPHLLDLFAFWTFACWTTDCIFVKVSERSLLKAVLEIWKENAEQCKGTLIFFDLAADKEGGGVIMSICCLNHRV
jgi:hypothetical protein